MQSDGHIDSLESYTHSGKISDLSYKNGTLYSALHHSLNFWHKDENETWQLQGRFNRGQFKYINSIRAQDGNFYIASNNGLEEINYEDLYADRDESTLLNSDYLGPRNGEFIELDDGFLVMGYEGLHFYGRTFLNVSTIAFEGSQGSPELLQRPTIEGDRLFIPINGANGDYPKIQIYDIAALGNITLLGELKTSQRLLGKVQAVDNILYVVNTGESSQSTFLDVYDISDAAAPVKVNTIPLDQNRERQLNFSQEIYKTFLILVSDKTFLFDIRDPQSPVLIEVNEQLNTRGVTERFGKQLFSVAENSAGHVFAAEINLAPLIPTQSLEVREDESGSITLLTVDDEGDELEYDIQSQASHGEFSISESNQITYQPASDYNGEDQGTVVVRDPHGNSSEFTVEVTVEPVNDSPVAAQELLTGRVTEGSSITLPLGITDADNDPLEFELVEKPTKGNLTIADNGSITFSANADATGADSVSVVATDIHGETVSVLVEFTIIPKPSVSSQSSGSGGGALSHLVLLLLLLAGWKERSTR